MTLVQLKEKVDKLVAEGCGELPCFTNEGLNVEINLAGEDNFYYVFVGSHKL